MIEGKTVLVIDDDQDIRDLITIWLSGAGYKIITAADANDGVKKLSKAIQIILLDIMMPGPKPAVVLKNIAKKAPNAVVAYLTAVEAFNVTPDQAEKGWVPVITPQVKGYIQKPITQEELIEQLYELIDKQKRYVASVKKKPKNVKKK